MAEKTVNIVEIVHEPSVGGIFSVYWRCASGEGNWILASDNVSVNPDGTLIDPLEIVFDSSECDSDIVIQSKINGCNSDSYGTIVSIYRTTTTSTTTTTTTTVPCPTILQAFGVGYTGTP